MRRTIGILPIVMFAVAELAHADTVAIGQLTLSYDNGYQDISFFNLTGAGQGCQIDGLQYSVCNGIAVSNWTLTITATNENPPSSDPSASYNNNLSSQITFTGGPSDVITPYDGINPYIGGSSGTWQIPLNFDNSDEPLCPPTCDYQITQVTFSGTISAADLPLELGNSTSYNGSDPSTYTSFDAEQTFSSTWDVSSDDDYSIASLPVPQLLYDSADVLVSNQAPVSSVPEPGEIGILTALFLVLAAFKLIHGRQDRPFGS